MAEPVPTRVAGLDALRGAAFCGMAAYHLAWDLHALGWTPSDPAASPGWSLLGDAVAATFLTLSGIGLALARPKGARSALRRLAVLAAAAAAVTGASLRFAPDAPILFGILHCIAVADAVALAVLNRPAWVRLVLAGLAAAVPALFGSPAFDGWPGAALGLAGSLPPTLDLRPLLPWLSAVLVGTVAGDALASRPRRPPAEKGGARGLRWIGRHSLALYLVHQPILYGALLLVGVALGPPTGEADPLDRRCRADCTATGAAPGLCAAACACTAERLAAEARSGSAGLTQRHLDDIGAACRRAGG